MSFPFEIEEEETETTEQISIPREYEFDFNTGKLTGRIVDGVDAIKTWIYLALKTPRYNHTIYSWDYGSELNELIGKGYSNDHLEIEVERMLNDCLLINENITSIDNITVTRTDDNLTVSFTVNTLLGGIDVNV